MTLIVCLWAVLPFTALLFTVVRGEQRCHVCVSIPSSASEVEQLFPGATLVSCRHTPEVKLCPDNYRGCLTQTSKEGQVTRTCAQLSINGCNSANGVEYCYCVGQLCNAPPAGPPPLVTDDEDLLEGSGAPPRLQTTLPPPSRITTLAPSTNHTSASTTLLGSTRALSAAILVLVSVWR